MSTATVTAGKNPHSIAIDPSGKYVYVANYGDGTVSQYTVRADGSLSPMATPTVSTGVSLEFVAVDLSGRFVYVTIWGGGVLQYMIGTDGGLIPLNPATVATGFDPLSIATTGQFQ